LDPFLWKVPEGTRRDTQKLCTYTGAL
jgi:hypothetical protein